VLTAVNSRLPYKFTVELSENPASIPFVRHITRLFLAQLNVSEDEVHDWEIVAGELGGNAVRHGGSDRGKFDLIVLYTPDYTELTVRDYGKGFRPDATALPMTEREDMDGSLRFGGLGLPMVSQLTDSLSVSVTESVGLNGPYGATVTARKTKSSVSVPQVEEYTCDGFDSIIRPLLSEVGEPVATGGVR
jgi:anti-sigma regulatory factor (Ser/Thr protein kinase)